MTFRRRNAAELARGGDTGGGGGRRVLLDTRGELREESGAVARRAGGELETDALQLPAENQPHLGRERPSGELLGLEGWRE